MFPCGQAAYREKVDKHFAPFKVVEKFNVIEMEFWLQGYGGVQSAFAALNY